MKNPAPLLLPMLLAVACEKDVPPTTTPDSALEETAPTEVAGEESRCEGPYSVIGEVNGGVLTESINGVVITDEQPFICTLSSREQQVVFNFNDDATDPTNECKYVLTYTNTVTGEIFSGSQTLDCSNATLDFKAVGDSENPDCPQVVDDPQIQLKTNNCGTNKE